MRNFSNKKVISSMLIFTLCSMFVMPINAKGPERKGVVLLEEDSMGQIDKLRYGEREVVTVVNTNNIKEPII